MDIRSSGEGAAHTLSNFAANGSWFRGVWVASMEALLQALKRPSPSGQLAVLGLIGQAARKSGQSYHWQTTGYLYWMGIKIYRFSNAYQRFLNEAYLSMFVQNRHARQALLSTGSQPLTHSIGKSNPRDTILTGSEFVSRLMWIRATFAGMLAEMGEQGFEKKLAELARGGEAMRAILTIMPCRQSK